MAVDLGKARTGIAACDKTEYLAYPVDVIAEHNRERLLEKVSDKARELKAELLVVGLPKNMDGTEGFRADKTYKFADKLKKVYNGEIVFVDERMTTVGASQFLNVTNTRGQKRKDVIDTVSACLILETYMNKKNRG